MSKKIEPKEKPPHGGLNNGAITGGFQGIKGSQPLEGAYRGGIYQKAAQKRLRGKK